jgi:fructokinase
VTEFRIGIDFGGSKIEIAAIGPDGAMRHRRRVATPLCYKGALDAIIALVAQTEAALGTAASIGIGLPGRLEPRTGLVHNGNCLNGQAFGRDIAAALGRTVRIANDANCFALSEASDGAGQGHEVVFGAVLGTGCGGGIVIGGRLLQGPNGIGGEWGHNLFPFAPDEQRQPQACWCGQLGCVEQMVAGPALARECDGQAARDAGAVARRAAAGDAAAQAALARHAGHLARALAQIVNLLDPDAIVLGGGLSNMDHLYARLPALMAPYVFNGACATPILRNRHGDSSGVRGAAWLWPVHETAPA